jgi:hypothetical protein
LGIMDWVLGMVIWCLTVGIVGVTCCHAMLETVNYDGMLC